MAEIIIKDPIRSMVETMSGGRQTVIYSASGQPNFMNIIPKFKASDLSAELVNATHPAFIVNGVEKDYFMIGTFQSSFSGGELVSQPNAIPHVSTNWANTKALARKAGSQFHMTSNAEWAAVMLLLQASGVTKLKNGNTNYGACKVDATQTAIRIDGGKAGDNTVTTNPKNRTGAGPLQWTHDGTYFGLADLVGNVSEWVSGAGIRGGEFQVIPDNNAADATYDDTWSGQNWRAIDGSDGSLIVPVGSAPNGDYTPSTPNGIKYQRAGFDYVVNTVPPDNAFAKMYSSGPLAISDAALKVMRTLGLYPLSNSAGMGGVIAVTGPLIRGGSYRTGAMAGIGLLVGQHPNSLDDNIGSRLAYIP